MRITAPLTCLVIALLGISFLFSADELGDVIIGVVALAYGGGNIAYMLLGPTKLLGTK